ncbi:MAG: T9SS type A sorting domain-containing protein [Crocinitomicaceae bacterium]|nr:T9SS type A sorting domain-containing protein [Crocinitomicaceae bacterium]
MKIFFLLLLLSPTLSISQNLLFSSGFEDTVQLYPPVASGGQWYQYFSGTDLSTGYQWPNDLPTQTPLDAYWTFKVPDTVLLSDYAKVELDSNVTHSGAKSLYMEVSDYNNGNFGNSMAGWVRCEYRLNLDTNLRQAYISYWMKVQPNFYTIMPFGTNRWRIMMEWFETGQSGSDYRWGLSPRVSSLASDSSSAYWLFFQNYQVGSGAAASFIDDTSYYHQDVVSTNDWFKVEVYWNQAPDSTGRILAAINGQTIFDEYGRNMNDTTPSVLSNWQIFKLYVDEPSMDDGTVFQWIDDVEIWDSIPNGAFLSTNSNTNAGKVEELNVFPNPSHGKYRIKSSWTIDPSNDKLRIMSIDGQDVKAKIRYFNNYLEIEIPNAQKGLYLLQVEHEGLIYYSRLLCN